MSRASLVKGVMAAALALVVAAPAVHAADLGGRPSYKDEPDYGAPRYLWTGLYGGLQAGYGWGTSNHFDGGGSLSGNFDTDGFLGGATLGYNFQRGQIVWGIETDFSFSDVEGTRTIGIDTYRTTMDWLWTVRGRLGVDMNGWLPYITAGLAVADVSARTLDVGTYNLSTSDTLTGWTAGAGLEVKLDRAWSLKAEYLYVDLGDISHGGGVKADVDEFHVVRGGLNYKF
jgi:outer membrane immunogenic protein